MRTGHQALLATGLLPKKIKRSSCGKCKIFPFVQLVMIDPPAQRDRTCMKDYLERQREHQQKAKAARDRIRQANRDREYLESRGHRGGVRPYIQ